MTACGLIAAALMLPACRNQEGRPAELKSTLVAPVELYGQTLGPEATPQQVAYALMQAMRDDVKASQAHDREGYMAAFQKQLDLAAPKRIHKNLRSLGATSETPTQAELDDNVYRVVRFWASIPARYVDSFEPDAEVAMAAMRVKTLPGGDARVSYDVTDPVDGSRVTFQVFLAQEPDAAGTQKYWRVYRLGYAPLGNDDAAVAPHPAIRTVPTTSPQNPATQES